MALPQYPTEQHITRWNNHLLLRTKCRLFEFLSSLQTIKQSILPLRGKLAAEKFGGWRGNDVYV